MSMPDPGPNWRRLRPDEVIVATDQCWDWRSNEWRPVPDLLVGLRQQATGTPVARRDEGQ